MLLMSCCFKALIKVYERRPFLTFVRSWAIMRGKTLDLPIDPPHLNHYFKICYYHSFSCTISGFQKNLITQVNFLYSLIPLQFLPFFTSSVFIMPSLQCRGSNKARKVTRREPFRRTTVWEA